MYKTYQKGRYQNYKLTYFNLRGRGEGVRYMLAAAEIPYEDKRIKPEEWGALKDSTPFGHLPVLEVDGVQLSEGSAIARFVGKMGGMYGDTEVDQAIVDSIVDTCTDVREKVTSIMQSPGEMDEKLKAVGEFFQDKGKATLEKLQTIIDKNDNGNGYFVGKQLSLADVWFYHCLELVMNAGSPDLLKQFSKLEALYKKVETTPSIAAYIKNRPETPY